MLRSEISSTSPLMFLFFEVLFRKQGKGRIKKGGRLDPNAPGHAIMSLL
jgi:hypothetical protein